MGGNNQDLNLVLHPNGQTNFTGSVPIQNNHNNNVEFTDFTHGNLVHDKLNQRATFNNNSVGQNSMIPTGVNTNNNMSTTYQSSQISNTYQNDQILISR